MLRAVRATMEGRFADAERLAAEARDAGRAAGHEAADRIWVTNREAQLRAADRHEDMLAWEPEARRSRAVVHVAAAWQAMGSALMHARLERAADARLHVELLPEAFRTPGGNLFALFFVGEAVAIGGPPELARALYEAHQAAARRLRDAGLELPRLGGAVGARARAAGRVAGTLGRGVRPLRGRDRALPPPGCAALSRADGVRVRARVDRARAIARARAS